MPVVLRNNATTTLASSLTTAAVTLSVKPGDGAKFPNPAAGEWFPVTLVKASNANEIVRCTGRSGDALTIVRAQEGTAAQTFAAGDRVELRLTAAVVAEQKTETAAAQAAADTAQAAADTAQAAADTAQAAADIGVKKDAATATGAAIIPAGTLAQRPSVTQPGMFRLNSESDLLEVFDGGAWEPLSRKRDAGSYKGGVVQAANVTLTPDDAGKYYFTSTSSVTFTLPNPDTLALGQKFIVATGSSAQLVNVTAAAGSISNINGAGGTSGSSIVLEPSSMYEFVAITSTAYHALKVSALGKRECTAWVNFNGTGIVTIRDSYNVSSITDLGTGQYAVNFAVARPNASYAILGTARAQAAGTVSGIIVEEGVSSAPSQSGFVVNSKQAGSFADSSAVHVCVFGGG